MAAMSTARERPTYDSMSKTGIDRVNSYDTVGHISMTTPYVALPTLDYGSAWPFGSGSGRVTGQWVWIISASRPGHRIQRADHRAVADHPVAVDEEDPLLQRGHGVVVEPADEIAIHHVEPRAAQLRAGVAVGERVGEAHHRRASGLEGAAIAQPVDRVEPLVGIADEGIGRRAVTEEDPRGLEQIGADLDDLGAGAQQLLVALGHAPCRRGRTGT